MAKSGNGENGNGGLNPGFSVSYNSESGNFTPSGPTTPSWAPGNTPGSGGTNPAGLNESENNKDSKNDINLNEAATKNEAAKKNAEKSNDATEKNAEKDVYNVNKEYSKVKNRGENHLNPSFEYAVTPGFPTNKRGNPSKNNDSAPADTSAPATSETAAPSVSETLGGATNTGVTYRGGTVTTPSGTSVTDSGTGGSISSSITPPTRDESSIGLGVYNNDRANYDQDNWNRGMESESSSLVSDEECKVFAKRAFMEDSEPFKVVRTTILKKI